MPPLRRRTARETLSPGLAGLVARVHPLRLTVAETGPLALPHNNRPRHHVLLQALLLQPRFPVRFNPIGDLRPSPMPDEVAYPLVDDPLLPERTAAEAGPYRLHRCRLSGNGHPLQGKFDEHIPCSYGAN